MSLLRIARMIALRLSGDTRSNFVAPFSYLVDYAVMALQIVEFFGFAPLDRSSEAVACISNRRCPFVATDCIKPNHGSCSVRQATNPEPVICCPNRLYADNFKVLRTIADQVFGSGATLVKPNDLTHLTLTGNEVAVFGRYWGRELPLPRPAGASAQETRKYYLDWILAKLDSSGALSELTAVEVQTIDTTGNYSDQVRAFRDGVPFTDAQGRNPGYSNAGMNWENVNKRILPQVIYKGHVLRREAKCRKGMYFICPKPVYDRIRDRLGGTLHDYQPGNGTITFMSYDLGSSSNAGDARPLQLTSQFTTTVDQIALAFTAPMNLPQQNVYEAAIANALG